MLRGVGKTYAPSSLITQYFGPFIFYSNICNNLHIFTPLASTPLMYNRRQDRPPTKPKPSCGHLYYVRLKTDLGIFYKLGFTTLGSVQERFAYQGKGHDALIDEVLLFSYREDAYEVEQLLHEHFRNKATFGNPEEGMPFFGNGQSELYTEDILNLDMPAARGKIGPTETQTNITTTRGKKAGLSNEEINDRLEIENNILLVLSSLSKAFRWIIIGYKKFEEWNAPDAEKNRRNKVRYILDSLRKHKREFWTQWLHRRTKIIKDPHEELKSDVRKAISAFKRKDLQAFENIINIPLFSYNLAEAMTSDMCFGSDFINIANCCGMFELIKLDGNESPRDLLLKPVEETYKNLLRGLVKNHRLFSEAITIPDDPKYCVGEKIEGYEYGTLSSYYGPGNFLDLFGREWILPDNPKFEVGVGSVEFSVEVRNQKTGFRGFLIIKAMYTSNQKNLA